MHSLLLQLAGACLGKDGMLRLPKSEAAAPSKAGGADEMSCRAYEVFTEETCLVAFKWGYYGLHHVLVTSCVAAPGVMRAVFQLLAEVA